jgi:hypothetical protein
MIKKIINEEKPVINITGLNLNGNGKSNFCFGFITSFVEKDKNEKLKIVTERIIEVIFPLENTENLSMIRAFFKKGEMNQPKVEAFVLQKNDILSKIKAKPSYFNDGQTYLESFCFDNGVAEALDWYNSEFTKSKGIL